MPQEEHEPRSFGTRYRILNGFYQDGKNIQYIFTPNISLDGRSPTHQYLTQRSSGLSKKVTVMMTEPDIVPELETWENRGDHIHLLSWMGEGDMPAHYVMTVWPRLLPESKKTFKMLSLSHRVEAEELLSLLAQNCRIVCHPDSGLTIQGVDGPTIFTLPPKGEPDINDEYFADGGNVSHAMEKVGADSAIYAVNLETPMSVAPGMAETYFFEYQAAEVYPDTEPDSYRVQIWMGVRLFDTSYPAIHRRFLREIHREKGRVHPTLLRKIVDPYLRIEVV